MPVRRMERSVGEVLRAIRDYVMAHKVLMGTSQDCRALVEVFQKDKEAYDLFMCIRKECHMATNMDHILSITCSRATKRGAGGKPTSVYMISTTTATDMTDEYLNFLEKTYMKRQSQSPAPTTPEQAERTTMAAPPSMDAAKSPATYGSRLKGSISTASRPFKTNFVDNVLVPSVRCAITTYLDTKHHEEVKLDHCWTR
jgi:hypothetical protein